MMRGVFTALSKKKTIGSPKAAWLSARYPRFGESDNRFPRATRKKKRTIQSSDECAQHQQITSGQEPKQIFERVVILLQAADELHVVLLPDGEIGKRSIVAQDVIDQRSGECLRQIAGRLEPSGYRRILRAVRISVRMESNHVAIGKKSWTRSFDGRGPEAGRGVLAMNSEKSVMPASSRSWRRRRKRGQPFQHVAQGDVKLLASTSRKQIGSCDRVE